MEEVVLVLMVVVWWVFLDGVLDVVELLAGGDDAVMEGIIVFSCWCQRRRRHLRADPHVGTLLPPPPNTPQQHRGDCQHPDNNHHGNQQGHNVVWWTERRMEVSEQLD